jgi:hypothetical protein
MEKLGMVMKPKFKESTLLDFYRLFLGLAILENILASWYLFSIPSKALYVFLAGYSLHRIGAGFAIFFVLGVYIFFLYDSFRSRKFLKFLASRLEIILNIDVYHILIRSSLIIIVVSSLASSLSYLFPGFQRFVFFVPNSYLFSDLGTLAAVLIGWVFLISLKMLILDLISGRQASRPVSIQTLLMVISWVVEIFVALYFVLWSWVERKLMLEILQGLGVNTLILSVWFSLWALLTRHKEWAKRIFHPFVCISIWLSVFIVSLQFAQWFGRWYTPTYSYFNFLASSFMHGNLYLINPPATGDLVFFNGHWFLPLPPFPAILMLPFIAILGIQAFNTTTFSLALAATTAVTIYLILNQLIQSGWIKLSLTGAIWLTALFSFGTMYWWLSIDSRVWFFSQVVTVLFSGLAFLSVLKKWSAWITGICLAAAILCRPDVFVLWPALIAIAIQLHLNDLKAQEKVNGKYILKWGVFSAIPVVIVVGLLLYYNFLRFGNFFDFEYGNLQGGPWILKNVQEYGLFSPHFMAYNLHWMFLAPPPLSAECGYYLTRGWGMSMFATTPAIIYVFRRFKISWWTCGCWCSILLSIIVLSMYSNNGALQYGSRYMLDFTIPMIMLIAYNAGERISAPLKTLIIASIFINYYGTISWFRGPC